VLIEVLEVLPVSVILNWRVNYICVMNCIESVLVRMGKNPIVDLEPGVF
jgi:hypothetical protein